MEPQEYDEIIRHLVRIAAHQETMNQDQRTLNERHRKVGGETDKDT